MLFGLAAEVRISRITYIVINSLCNVNIKNVLNTRDLDY